jgi:hypothetical protein
MPAPGQATWDGNPNASPPITAPYRPSSADFNGASLSDDPVFPPNPATMPTAELLNTYSLQLVTVSRMCPNIRAGVTGGTAPFISAFTATPTAVYGASAAGTFGVTRGQTGQVTVYWNSGAFPASLTPPSAYLNGSIGPTGACVSIGATTFGPTANGVVVTTTQGNAYADLPFCFEVW